MPLFFASHARFSTSFTLAFVTPSPHNQTSSLCSSQATCPSVHCLYICFFPFSLMSSSLLVQAVLCVKKTSMVYYMWPLSYAMAFHRKHNDLPILSFEKIPDFPLYLSKHFGGFLKISSYWNDSFENISFGQNKTISPHIVRVGGNSLKA